MNWFSHYSALTLTFLIVLLLAFIAGNALSSGTLRKDPTRRAMTDMKKQRPDPRPWASFVMFGTPR